MINEVKDLIDDDPALHARNFALFYFDGTLDFDTDCRWSKQRADRLKKEVLTKLGLETTVSSRLLSREGFPTRRVRVQVLDYHCPYSLRGATSQAGG